MPLLLRLEGALDVEALRRSLDALVARHEILRTTYTAARRTTGRAEVIGAPARSTSRWSKATWPGPAVLTDYVSRPFDLATEPGDPGAAGPRGARAARARLERPPHRLRRLVACRS